MWATKTHATALAIVASKSLASLGPNQFARAVVDGYEDIGAALTGRDCKWRIV
jgi:hypothetical protein